MVGGSPGSELSGPPGMTMMLPAGIGIAAMMLNLSGFTVV
jgi:uncharacterized protein YjlB